MHSSPDADSHAQDHPARTPAKSQLAYEELRRRIVDMELKPGVALFEGELIASLNVGRTPVREAIQRLAAERLVIAPPRQTPHVAPILAHELSEVIEMRFVLEVPAARYAAMRATAAEREAIAHADAEFHRAVPSGNIHAIAESDNEIHRLIGVAAHNSYLLDSTERMAVFSRRLWRLSSHSVRFDDEAFRNCHDELVEAIVRGDADDAAAAATAHVLMFKRRLSQLVHGTVDVSPSPPAA